MAAALPMCYHGALSKEECEHLLGKKNRDGAYLIRDSETIQGAMCLCVYKKKVVYTYRLLQSHNGQYTLLTAGGLEEVFFKTLDDLIHHYKRKNQGLAMHLRHSVKRKTAMMIQPPKSPERAPENRLPHESLPEKRSPDERLRERSPAASSHRVELPLPEDEDHDYENLPESDYIEVLPEEL